jgi:hypothetical protein
MQLVYTRDGTPVSTPRQGRRQPVGDRCSLPMRIMNIECLGSECQARRSAKAYRPILVHDLSQHHPSRTSDEIRGRAKTAWCIKPMCRFQSPDFDAGDASARHCSARFLLEVEGTSSIFADQRVALSVSQTKFRNKSTCAVLTTAVPRISTEQHPKFALAVKSNKNAAVVSSVRMTD